MFYYLGSIVGQTQEEVKTKWGGGDDGETEDPDPVKLQKQKDYRMELLTKAMPFIQKVTQKDFDEKNPFADKEYIKYIMVLGSYTPGYQNYKPDPEDKKGVNEITAEEKEKIKIKMAGDDGKGGKKGEIKKLIKQIKDRHSGNDAIDKEIVKQMTEAENELDSVDAETACDEASMDKLKDARQKLKEKVKDAPEGILQKDDISDLNSIADLIEKIFQYCNLESYRTK